MDTMERDRSDIGISRLVLPAMLASLLAGMLVSVLLMGLVMLIGAG